MAHNRECSEEGMQRLRDTLWVFTKLSHQGKALGEVTMEIGVVAPQETRNRYLPYDPTIPGHRPRTLSILTERQVLIHVHCCSTHNSQDVEAAQMFICWWRHKENAVPSHNGTLFSGEEKWNLQVNGGNRKGKQPSPECRTPHVLIHA